MINYIVGDATAPQGDGMKFVLHVVNTVHAWGSGFVIAVSRKWREPERVYHSTHLHLGDSEYIKVEDDIVVVNMVAQKGLMNRFNTCPADLDALRKCLRGIAVKARENNASIHMPRVCCDRGGAKWVDVEEVINDEMSDLDVTVYDIKEGIDWS